MVDSVISLGRVAVITGAARGLGAAAARRLSAEGMRLSLFDCDEQALSALARSLETEVVTVAGDVANQQDLVRLRDTTVNAFGEVALLMNNAAIKDGAGPWDGPAAWRRHLDVNLFSLITTQHLFVPIMLKQQGRSAIVNLGSKEGITTPPGNAAYSVGKAGVKVLTEQLAHELHVRTGDKVTAHLLVPGYTWTPMNGMKDNIGQKPAAAWTADQVIEYFTSGFRQGDFYIICPDNEVTAEMDKKRITWAYEDMTKKRPALSRWHPGWEEAFSDWMKNEC